MEPIDPALFNGKLGRAHGEALGLDLHSLDSTYSSSWGTRDKTI